MAYQILRPQKRQTPPEIKIEKLSVTEWAKTGMRDKMSGRRGGKLEKIGIGYPLPVRYPLRDVKKIRSPLRVHSKKWSCGHTVPYILFYHGEANYHLPQKRDQNNNWIYTAILLMPKANSNFYFVGEQGDVDARSKQKRETDCGRKSIAHGHNVWRRSPLVGATSEFFKN